ncbi:uncharacterized protein LOC143363727 [Halictus rubicundus]|uniref:uncharacterized protein LOC143363727 n=1 Tax=Halictus rubicundus TaxID=77578 RepID=UPI0040371B73
MMIKKEVNEEYLHFGLSTLHAWIRFFECCLHVSYRLDIKKWQMRTKKDKEIMENRKAIIQKGFRSQLGLVVDCPKPGYGSSNDGNTARRFFHNPEVSATITGLDEKLIKRFHVILQVVSSGHKIDISKFKEYTIETARTFVELYPWYYMPTSMHKLLIHGPQIITSSLLPIGQMSEEAQEASHKHVKRIREDFSRKSSRTKTMEDVFLRLMVTSDPYISSIRKLPKKKMKSLSPEALKMLLSPFVPYNERQTVAQEENGSEEGSDIEDDSDE